MLSRLQIAILLGCAILFWAAAACLIRWLPWFAGAGAAGNLLFLASIPLCWVCIVVVRAIARLRTVQLIPATSFVVAVATLIDSTVLRWMPAVYGRDERILRFGAAWLLWGYGITLGWALLLTARASFATRPVRSFEEGDPG